MDYKKMIRELVVEIDGLADLIDEAHDTHIWSDDDGHPKGGCSYCNSANGAREKAKAALKELKKKG